MINYETEKLLTSTGPYFTLEDETTETLVLKLAYIKNAQQKKIASQILSITLALHVHCL